MAMKHLAMAKAPCLEGLPVTKVGDLCLCKVFGRPLQPLIQKDGGMGPMTS